MNSLIITIHVIACVTLVVLVLLQSGKEGMGVIFGGGGGSLFGSSGAGSLLSKLTAGAATVFFLTSMVFTYISTQKHTAPRESIVLDMPVNQAPAGPATAPAQEQNAQQPAGQEKSQ
ncbi:MAG: preprotein translocase subunit SecG [Desulfovibrionales bacterium]|nr:preprotein translocase subunit SecG [Desulfovibrionales bacterium]